MKKNFSPEIDIPDHFLTIFNMSQTAILYMIESLMTSIAEKNKEFRQQLETAKVDVSSLQEFWISQRQMIDIVKRLVFFYVADDPELNSAWRERFFLLELEEVLDDLDISNHL